MRLGGIDIGSNAVRLLVADVLEQKDGDLRVKKLKLFRVPVRLGIDTFSEGMIAPTTVEKLIKAMKAFRLMMEVYDVEDYMACATSALRQSSNKQEVVANVATQSGIHIQIIDGEQEAELIQSNRITHLLDKRFDHLYMDVGGGSTELSLLSGEQFSHARSFQVGTIRLFKNKVKPTEWQAMEDWLTQTIKPQKPLAIIGSGGNINRIFKRAYLRAGTPLLYSYLKQERELLAALDIQDRVQLQDLNIDRAEVIVPALDIFLFVMEATGIQQVFVPKIGVADGLVKRLYRQKKSRQQV